MARFAIFWVVSLACFPIWALVTRNEAPTQVPRPSQDPFYAVSPGFDRLPPGSILNFRRPPSALAAFGQRVDAFVEDAHQILYRTTDNQNRATATVMTVLVPPKADFTKVVSFQIAEDAVSLDCTPSFALLRASSDYPALGSKIVQLQIVLALQALHRGWVVIVPDTQGLKSVFSAGKLAACSILDGIRAAMNSSPFTGISKNATFALWGYSGGGSATLNALRMQSSYAPDLPIAGAALGGVGGNMSASYNPTLLVNKTPGAFFIPTLLLSAAKELPKIHQAIEEHLKPEYRSLFYSAYHQCYNENLKSFKNEDVFHMFDDQGLIVETVKHVVPVEGEIPKVPLFWYQSAQDMLIAPRGTSLLVEEYCLAGGQINYLTETAKNADHSRYGVIGAQEAIRWLDDVWDGKTRIGCTKRTTETRELDHEFLNVYPEELKQLLLDLVN